MTNSDEDEGRKRPNTAGQSSVTRRWREFIPRKAVKNPFSPLFIPFRPLFRKTPSKMRTFEASKIPFDQFFIPLASKNPSKRDLSHDLATLGQSTADSAPQPCPTSLEKLPDDALLQVLRYLDVPDLLGCRPVCKRLADLAVSPPVWRHRSLRRDSDPWFCPALRLAPCLADLTLLIRTTTSAERVVLYTTTACVLSKLVLYVVTKKATSKLQAALIIRNQEALGGLKHLYISFEDVGDPSVILWTVAFTSGLETLEVLTRVNNKLCTNCQPRPAPRASLRRVFFSLNLETEPFYNFVLATHRAALEDVQLLITIFTPSSTALLLADMPHLRRLECPQLPGLEAVAACASLREVSITLGPRDLMTNPSAAEFLRRATQLRDVTLEYCLDAEASRPVAVDLVVAMASSGRSDVESLKFKNPLGDGQVYANQQGLLGALERLPALKYLQLDTAPGELLKAVAAGRVSALQTLRLQPAWKQGPRCAHGYMHSDVVQTILSSNSFFELCLLMQFYCSKSHPCEYCSQGCHRYKMWTNVCPYSDDESDEYDSDDYEEETAEEHFFKATHWIKIPQLRSEVEDSTSSPLV